MGYARRFDDRSRIRLVGRAPGSVPTGGLHVGRDPGLGERVVGPSAHPERSPLTCGGRQRHDPVLYRISATKVATPSAKASNRPTIFKAMEARFILGRRPVGLVLLTSPSSRSGSSRELRRPDGSTGPPSRRLRSRCRTPSSRPAFRPSGPRTIPGSPAHRTDWNSPCAGGIRLATTPSTTSRSEAGRDSATGPFGRDRPSTESQNPRRSMPGVRQSTRKARCQLVTAGPFQSGRRDLNSRPLAPQAGERSGQLPQQSRPSDLTNSTLHIVYRVG